MNIQSNKVSGNMTLDIIWLTPEDSIAYAHELMQTEDIRHIPILIGNKIVGILSDRDVLAASQKNSEHQVEFPKSTVDSIMTRFPITCHVDATIADVAGIMIGRKIDCLPVVDRENNLIGMITSTDLLSLLCSKESEMIGNTIPFEYNLARRSAYL